MSKFVATENGAQLASESGINLGSFSEIDLDLINACVYKGSSIFIWDASQVNGMMEHSRWAIQNYIIFIDSKTKLIFWENI